MKRSTQNKLMYFFLGAVVVLMNIGGIGQQIANFVGKDITYN